MLARSENARQRRVPHDFSYLLLTVGYIGSLASTIWPNKVNTELVSIASLVLVITHSNIQRHRKQNALRDKCVTYTSAFLTALKAGYVQEEQFKKEFKFDKLPDDPKISSYLKALFFKGEYGIQIAYNCISILFYIFLDSFTQTRTHKINHISMFNTISSLWFLYLSSRQSLAPYNANLYWKLILPSLMISNHLLLAEISANVFHNEFLSLPLTILFGLFDHFFISHGLEVEEKKVDVAIAELEEITAAANERRQLTLAQAASEQPQQNYSEYISGYLWGAAVNIYAFFDAPTADNAQPNLWRDWLPHW